MRGTTAKNLRKVARDLKATNKAHFETLTVERIYRRLKKVWHVDEDFRNSVIETYKKK